MFQKKCVPLPRFFETHIMIVDTLDRLDLYTGLNPRFALVADFLRQHDLSRLQAGIHPIDGDDVYVNVQDAPAKTRREARFESHRRMIDIQVPISSVEEYGWAPLEALPAAEYDETVDMTFHDPVPQSSPEEVAQIYFPLQPGQFAIFFPKDGHAPAITDKALRKAIFKVKA